MTVRNPFITGSSFQPKRFRNLIPVLLASMMIPQPTGAHAATSANPPTLTIKLAWNPVPETVIRGYRLYVGTASNQYSAPIETGNVTTFPVGNLVAGLTYYFAVRAVSTAGIEGALSDELMVVMDPVPAAVADSYAVGRDTPLVVPSNGVLANDSDLDSTLLAAVLESGPARGSLTLNPDGGFVYTPDPGFTGKDSFLYRATDGTHVSEATEVSLAVSEPLVELLANGSFESGVNGWSASGNQRVEVKASPYHPSDGTKLMVFNGLNQAPNASLSQSFPTVLGETYTLEFDTTVVAFNWDPQSLAVEVIGKTSLVAESIPHTGVNSGAIPWRKSRFTFVADASTTVLTFRDKSPSTASIDLLLDKVSVVGPRGRGEIPGLAEGNGTPSLAGSPGAMNVGMTVTAAGSYVLQRSEDLVKWDVVGTTSAAGPGKITFLDSKPTAGSNAKVFYRISPPAGTSGTAGSYGDQAIPSLAEGDGTPSLSGSPGAISVGMTVTAAGSYVLQRSVNLVNWEDVGTTTATGSGRISFIDSKMPVGTQLRMFYRIRMP